MGKIEVIAPEDANIIEEAEKRGDSEFIKNPRQIRHLLMLRYANPMVDRVDLKLFAQQHGISHQTVVDIKNSNSFKAELKDYIGDILAEYSDGILESTRTLIRMAKDGNLKAMKMLFDYTGVGKNMGATKPIEQVVRELEEGKDYKVEE